MKSAYNMDTFLLFRDRDNLCNLRLLIEMELDRIGFFEWNFRIANFLFITININVNMFQLYISLYSTRVCYAFVRPLLGSQTSWKLGTR